MGYFFDAIRRTTEEAGTAAVKESPAAAPRRESLEKVFPLDQAAHPAETAIASSRRIVTGAEHPGDADTLLAREQYRVLRTKILEAMRVREFHSVLVSSATPGEGKTTVSLNLALTIASQHELRVCLIDTDLRRPGLARLLGWSDGEGLDAYLLGKRDWRDGLRTVHERLNILPTNPVPDRAGELITFRSMQRVMQELLLTHDLLILDGPPLTSVAEGQVLAAVAESAILVVRSGQSNYQAVVEAAQPLGKKLLGSVLNSAPNIPHGEYFYKYIVQDQASKAK